MLRNKSGAAGDARPEGSEAAAVSDWYASCRESLAQPLEQSLPAEWLAAIEAKELLFRGVADWHTGSSEMVQASKAQSIAGLAKVLRASQHLKQARACCQRTGTLDARLEKMVGEYIDVVQLVLGRVNPTILTELEPKIAHMGPVHGKAVRWSTGVCDMINEWTQRDDMFVRIGPVYFFNSMCALVERRSHSVRWSGDKSYGLSTSGGNPVRISDVAFRTPAHAAGVLAGDYIITVNGIDARCMVTTEVEELLAELCADEKDLELTVVVNYDMQNFEELINPEVPKCVRSVSQMLPMPSVWSSGVRKFALAGRGNTKLNLLGAEC